MPDLSTFRVATLMWLALVAAGCGTERNSLLAPTGANIALTAAQRFVPLNTSTTVTVQVTHTDGTPSQDGTEVFLTATGGAMDQFKVRTAQGRASAVFAAGPDPGPAEVRAVSGEVSATLTLNVGEPAAQIVLTAEPSSLPVGGGDTTITAAVRNASGGPVAQTDVEFSTSAGTLQPQGPVTTDPQGLARITLTASETAVLTARTQTVNAEITVDVEPPPPPDLELATVPGVPRAGEPVEITIRLIAGGEPATAGLRVTFGDGAQQDLGQITGSARLTHTYGVPGGYNLSAHVALADGQNLRWTFRVEVAAPLPGPPPAPAPPAPGPGGNEPIDLRQVTWLHTDVSNWRVTSTITNVTIGDPPICIEHTKAGRWPVMTFDGVALEGNPWVFVNLDGRWYAATYEWLRPGQTCKNISASTIGPHIKRSPLDRWRPRSGELVGFMVSALARSGQKSVAERSNVVMVRWP